MNSNEENQNDPTSTEDAFKARFKWFKGNTDYHLADENDIQPQDIYSPSELTNILRMTSVTDCQSESDFGLRPVESWRIARFKFPEGLTFIENPFTDEGQRYWISTCLKDYGRSPHMTNISNLESRNCSRQKQGRTRTLSNSEEYYRKLRWVTFGYHHNWDTKIYSESHKCDFPEDLAGLTRYMAEALGFQDFKAEAAIVNYYNLDSTLSGHQDRSEDNMEAPLFSISFGQTAVFLIGGETKDIRPRALFLKSGDVVVMAGKSRLSYHGVPKILQSDFQPWNPSESISSSEPEVKKSRVEHSPDPLIISSDSKWDSFTDKYANQCRINLNVRQVLFPKQDALMSAKLK